MKIQESFIRWFVLLVCFLPSFSWANYNGFPIEAPQVTGTFMEYRPAGRIIGEHFHGGIDLIPGVGVSNNIVFPVANGNLTYEMQVHVIEGISKLDTTYTLRIRHDTGPYAGFGTRYLHVGEYPAARSDHPKFHRAGFLQPPRMGVTTSDTLGTIVTPHDRIPDHLHFEVFRRTNLDYINPLKYLPRIEDAGINHSAEGWTWSILDNDFIEPGYWDTPVVEGDAIAEGIPLPPLSFRLLFKGFDRINTPDRYLGFYSIKAWLKRYDSLGDTVGILDWTFTADEFPANLYNSPHYILNDRNSVHNVDDDNDEDHHSTLSQFFYRLFAHAHTGLSIQRRQHTDFCADFPLNLCLDSDGWMAGNISSAHFFEVEVFDFDKDRDGNLGHSVSRRLSIPLTAVGDFLGDLEATPGTRQVLLNWNSSRGGEWTHFTILRSQDSGISYTEIGSVPYECPPAQSYCAFEYVDETATESVNYYYRIFTDELYGPVWARPNGGDPVSAPSGTPVVSIPGADVGYFVLDIETGANYADYYRVEYGPLDQSFPWFTIVEATNRKTVSDDRLTEGRTYKVRLVGFNSAGRGTDSNVVQFSLGEVLEIDGPAEVTVTENYEEALGVYTVSGTADWSLSGEDAAAFELTAASSQASLSFLEPRQL